MAKCTSQCQRAHTSGCDCGCAASRHGAGWISWATSNEVPTAQTNALTAAKRQEKTLSAKRSNARRADAEKFFDAVRTVDLVNWLLEDADRRGEAEWIATQVANVCDTALTEHPEARARLADHFWCDVLASLVVVLDSTKDLTTQLADDTANTIRDIGERTWTEVRASRETAHGNNPTVRKASKGYHSDTRAQRDDAAQLPPEFLGEVAKKLAEGVARGAADGVCLKLELITLKLRVLAVFLCPDPYAHARVWNHCARPLIDEEIKTIVINYPAKLVKLFRVVLPD